MFHCRPAFGKMIDRKKADGAFTCEDGTDYECLALCQSEFEWNLEKCVRKPITRYVCESPVVGYFTPGHLAAPAHRGLLLWGNMAGVAVGLYHTRRARGE